LGKEGMVQWLRTLCMNPPQLIEAHGSVCTAARGWFSSVLLIHNIPCYCSVGVPAGPQGVGSSFFNGCIRFTCDLPRLS
jgi:hypothetical protein